MDSDNAAVDVGCVNGDRDGAGIGRVGGRRKGGGGGAVRVGDRENPGRTSQRKKPGRGQRRLRWALLQNDEHARTKRTYDSPVYSQRRLSGPSQFSRLTGK